MSGMNTSFQEAVCINNEVFFGPITDKERKIREEFEKKFNDKADNEANKVDNEISRNDSLYKSFSESKYDSFDDSLNVEVNDNPERGGLKPVTLKKSFDKLKSKNHGFYDSLEDVCSLVSNIDKCSISCDVETNFAEMHNIEDSLKNGSKVVINNNCSPNDQVHFDDDSLAIVELESTFDDSLEEFNVQSIEIEEVHDKESIVAETLNVSCAVEQKSSYVTKNLFDISVEIIYEKKAIFNTLDEVSSSDEKKLFDSLSNSDFRDVLKDSLEESQNCSSNLNSKNANSAVSESAQIIPLDHKALDESVQIIYEKVVNFQNMTESNISSSEGADLSKDSLENFKNKNIVITDQLLQQIVDEDSDFKQTPNNFVQPNENFADKELSTNEHFEDSRRNALYSNQESSPNEHFEDSQRNTPHSIQDSKSTTDSVSFYTPFSSQDNTNETDKVILLNLDKIHAMEKESSHSNTNSEYMLCETNENVGKLIYNNEANITQRIKLKHNSKNSKMKVATDDMDTTKLMQALDLHDISLSFFNESFVQSEDSIIALNLCMKKQTVEIADTYKDWVESKENMPQLNLTPLKNSYKNFHSSKHNDSSHKVRDNSKSPKKMKNNTPSKRTPGTKIPVRKVDNFALPISSQKIKHHVPKVASAEKVKKWPVTPYTSELGKNTPIVTPNKGHYCKVRNTIFSKVPQITPSKKFMNIKSPIAQYIRSTQSHPVMKTPIVDPVLRDCMNHAHMQQELESPDQVHHYQSPKSAPVKSTKRKA